MRKQFPTYAANAWAGSFSRALRRELRAKVSEPKMLVRQIRLNANEGFWREAGGISDDRERTMIASCWMVLSAYRVLLPHLPQSELVPVLRVVVGRVFQKPMRWMVRAWLWIARRPLIMLSKSRWLRFSEWMYGPGMEFDQEEGDGCVDLIVKRCAFHQFFVEHEVPQLTQVFCSWDRNWMDLIDASGRNLLTVRPSTLSMGGNCCRFRVATSSEASSAKHRDIVLGGESGEA